ncbi:unnamed protein product [Ambrosiozyma monospora]|uniref:Small nuclear ribonucleoprotein Sm D3 n=1 Tax=Ambrosiozyma monospora TaxID=43982 RepID=A0A9W6YVZ4_AMBMO|nr:unnamed protein product [Ambrosiozyma monospora]
MGVSLPVKLLAEAQGHVVQLELTTGQMYKGKLIESEDNMNVQLNDVVQTSRDGKVTHLDQVFIRGSQVRFFSVPEMLKHAPMFNPNNNKPVAPVRAPPRRR